VTDESGHPTAVMLDLKEWGDLWEEIYDGIIAEQRKDEPLIAWEEVKRQLAQNHEVVVPLKSGQSIWYSLADRIISLRPAAGS